MKLLALLAAGAVGAWLYFRRSGAAPADFGAEATPPPPPPRPAAEEPTLDVSEPTVDVSEPPVDVSEPTRFEKLGERDAERRHRAAERLLREDPLDTEHQ